MKELGLYIHIPFCVSKCKYCNFNSYANMGQYQNQYLKAILDEIIAFSLLAKNHMVTTIYIGGGTPSCFLSGGIKTILDLIKRKYNIASDVEISIEANPNSITYEKVSEWKEAGVNRVSVGLQSLDMRLLKLIGRTHTKQDYLKAIELLKSMGFNNINTDLMLGLPTQKQSHLKRTLKQVFKLDIPHISAYSLILEENTALYDMAQSGKCKLPKEAKVVSMYDYVLKTLRKHGYERYEVSNFAKEGFECRHNLNCWKMVEYLGFGAGANGYFDNMRYANASDIKEYIETNKLQFNEVQSMDDLLDEYIMLKLRTRDGLDINMLNSIYNYDILNTKKEELKYLKKYGLIELDDHIRATDEGFKVLNQIILHLVKD